MDPADRLTADQRRVVDHLAQLRHDFTDLVDAARDSNADDEHDPEGATIAFERAQVEALTRQAEQHLLDIDQALARVDAGSYGTCEVCGAAIPADRLDARPTARTCVSC